MGSADLKECPFCKEQIRKEAIKCRFCGEWLEERSLPKLELKEEHDNKTPPCLPQSNQEPSGPTAGIDATTPAEESSPAEAPAVQVPTSNGVPYKLPILQNPLVPLLLMAWWILEQAVPQAIKNGASGVVGIVLDTISYCTTPLSLLVLFLLGIWLWNVRLTKYSYTPHSKLSKTSINVLFALGVCLLILLAYTNIYSPVASSRAKAQHQTSSGPVSNPNALNGWEVLKKGQPLGDASTGLTPAAKKRMRELLALRLKGSLAQVTNLLVDLQGPDHDKLVFSFSNVDPTVASNLPHAIEEVDPDFWNEMRFSNFKEVVFAGAAQYESIPESKFSQRSHGYEAFVIAMNDRIGGGVQLSGSDGGELNPSTQKTMRQNLATVLGGALKSIYNSIEVRLEGESDDRLVIHLREMDAAAADGLLKGLQQDQTGNFWNGLRALAFKELILSGDNYRRSIPRDEFIQWCHDYEKYLSELQKAVGEFSGAVKHEAKAP
jgi:hypothetical protein